MGAVSQICLPKFPKNQDSCQDSQILPQSKRHADPLRRSSAHPAPHSLTGARKRGGLETVAAVKTRRRHVSDLVTGPGSRHGLGAQPAQPGTWSLRIPAMASSQGDVRPSPMAYPAVRPLPAKLPLPLRPGTGPPYLLVRVRRFGQNVTEHPAPSPSGHPFLSG